MKEYTVIYESGKRNWSAYVPDLPGCIATGKTRRDVKRMIREAIEFHLEGLRLHGDPIPEPSVVADVVLVNELRKAKRAEGRKRSIPLAKVKEELAS